MIVLSVTVTSSAPDSSTAVPFRTARPGCVSPLPKIVLFATVPGAPRTYDTPFCAINPSKGCGGPAVLPDTFMIVDPRGSNPLFW